MSNVKKGMIVTIQSSNDLLHAYEKAQTKFEVASVVNDGENEYVTLLFADDKTPFKAVVMGYEVVPYIALIPNK